MTPLVLEKNELLELMMKVLGAVDKKNIQPALSYCLVRIEHQTLTIIGGDADLQIQVTKLMKKKHQESHFFSLPARKVYDFCRLLPDETEVTLTFSGKRILLSGGASRLDVSTIDTQEYPLLEIPADNLETICVTKDIKHAIDSIAFCMAIADIRYYLNGLFFSFEGHSLQLVSTDGHRLAVEQISAEAPHLSKGHMIVPRRAILELVKVLDLNQPHVKIQLGRFYAVFEQDNLKFVAKLIEGKFPDYKRVLPKDLPLTVEIDREELKLALLQVQPFLSSKDKGAVFSFGGRRVTISAQNQESDRIAIELSYDGDPASVKIGFNINYLLDYLQSIKTRKIKLSFKDENVGVLVCSEGQGFYLVMPLKL